MGLFSFGNKDASTTSGRGSNPSGSTGRTSRRGADRAERAETEGFRRRRQSEPADANMLDPTLPEKQRARRRLIGAIALVLAAVVILPMVLDSHPKPATDGIAIEIPAHDDAPAPGAASASAGSTAAYEAADDDNGPNTGPAAGASTPATAGVAGVGPASSATQGAGAKASANAANASNTGTKSAGKSAGASSGNATTAATSNAPAARTTGGGTGTAATTATNTTSSTDSSGDQAGKSEATTAAKAPTANDAPPAGSHFVVQIGSFASDAPAQAWVVKLKAAGVPAYVQHARQDDGTDRVLVRAGPFVDRAAAEAAVRKVRTVEAPTDAANANAGH
ncbi:DedD protein [Pararobbsia alpina]|uniref:SPOR domain-containing protein n=1 Tax=Pararobbsia alpina TaxID=621374 RepID=UPI0039A5CCDB